MREVMTVDERISGLRRRLFSDGVVSGSTPEWRALYRLLVAGFEEDAVDYETFAATIEREAPGKYDQDALTALYHELRRKT